MEKYKKINANKGHRQRLKQRFLSTGFLSFSDHEVIELLLFYAIPYKDTKALAKAILDEFGGIKSLMESDAFEISTRCKISEHTAILLSLSLPLYKRYLQPNTKREDLSTPSKVWNFVKPLYINKCYECFYLLCLDGRRRLIKAVIISEGTIDEAPVYLRNIFDEALKCRAINVIFVHNHPSGNVSPSDDDIDMTKKISKALNIVNIRVLDHVIVSNDEFTSLRTVTNMDF